MASDNCIGWRWLLGVFTVAFTVYALSPVRQNFDSYLALPTAQSIVHDGNLTLDEFDTPLFETHGWRVTTDDGATVNNYPWVPSLMLVPAIVALDASHALGIGPGSYSVANGGRMDVIQQLSASAVVALVVALVFAIAFGRLDHSLALQRRRMIAAVVAGGFAFGTAAWSTASRAMWQHGPSLLFLGVAVLLCQRLLLHPTDSNRPIDRTALGMGAAVAASFTCRPTNAVAVVGFAIFVALRLRHQLARFSLGVAAVAVPWAAVNLATFGTLLPSYYRAGKVGLHDEFGLALATNLISPARGLLMFSPIVVLGIVGIIKRYRVGVQPGLLDLDRMLIGLSAAYLLVSSGAPQNWWGGHSFGPRFMSDTLVFFAVAATPTVASLWPRRSEAPSLRNRGLFIFAVAALSWSVIVNAQGGTMRSTVCWNGAPNIDNHTSRLWDFRNSQMLSGIQSIADSGFGEAFFTRCPDGSD